MCARFCVSFIFTLLFYIIIMVFPLFFHFHFVMYFISACGRSSIQFHAESNDAFKLQNKREKKESLNTSKAFTPPTESSNVKRWQCYSKNGNSNSNSNHNQLFHSTEIWVLVAGFCWKIISPFSLKNFISHNETRAKWKNSTKKSEQKLTGVWCVRGRDKERKT